MSSQIKVQYFRTREHVPGPLTIIAVGQMHNYPAFVLPQRDDTPT